MMLVFMVMHVALVFTISVFVVPPVPLGVVNGQGRSGSPPVPGGAGAGAGGAAGGGAVPQLPLLRGAFVPRSSFLSGRGGRSSNLGRSTIAGARNTATEATTADDSPLTSRADAFTRRIVARGGTTAFAGVGGRSASFGQQQVAAPLPTVAAPAINGGRSALGGRSATLAQQQQQPTEELDAAATNDVALQSAPLSGIASRSAS